jgi:ABC-2 type transport system ATP-binding protein
MIQTNGLSKHYGQLIAVDDLSFRVEPGEVLGFLGPNGAGKSTTMKMLAGFVAPTAGNARICGYDVETNSLEARRCLGYLPEGAPSYPEMTPAGFLSFVADVRGLTGAQRKARIDEVIGLLHLESVLHQTIETLSKGYKRRLGLAQALLHDPQVLILDEPTDGLDPNQKYEVRELINAISKDKVIIISTHILEEVDALCSRAIIIAHGRILADDTPANLETQSRFHNAVTLRIADPSAVNAVRDALAGLAAVARVETDQDSDKLTAFPKPGKQPLAEISEMAMARGWELKELHLESGRMDEVFRTITGGATS